MGKSRRIRGGASQRRDPIAKPVKPPSDPELSSIRQSKILPIVKDLESSDPRARTAAAMAISNIVQDTKCRKLLLREQIVHTILTQTLTDSALESRAAGWGILQTLAHEEEADFCVHLYRRDVLSAAQFACKNVSERLISKEEPFLKLPKAERNFTLSIASSLVLLLTCLAEAQDFILEAIANHTTIVHFLQLLIVQDSLTDSTSSLRNDTLTCLMVLSEDTENIAKIFTASETADGAEKLMQLKDSPAAEGTLACGVLHNIFATVRSSKELSDSVQVDDSVLIPTLSKVISTITAAQPVAEAGDGNSPFEYQQQALEILADIGTLIHPGNAESTLKMKPNGTNGTAKNTQAEMRDDMVMDVGDEAGDDDEEEEAEDGDDDNDEMDQDELEADMDLVAGAEQTEDSIDDLPTLKALLEIAVPELVRIASIQPENDDMIRLQGHSLAALNNIAWSVSVFDFSDVSNLAIKKAWYPAGRAIWQKVITPILASDTADIALATQVTSLGWAIARILGHETPVQPGEPNKFMTLYQATLTADQETQDPDMDPFQALSVKCLGLLGQLALDPAPLSRNREIGTFLLTQVSKLPDTPAAAVVEALNQLFDIYGDEEKPCDEVFWADNFLKHLTEIQHKLRAMVKSVNKNKHAELKLRIDEASLNLKRFLAYKKKHHPVKSGEENRG